MTPIADHLPCTKEVLEHHAIESTRNGHGHFQGCPDGNLLTQIGSLKTQLMLAKDKVQGQYLQQELSRIQAADAKARTLLEFSRAALKTVASRTLELTQ